MTVMTERTIAPATPATEGAMAPAAPDAAPATPATGGHAPDRSETTPDLPHQGSNPLREEGGQGVARAATGGATAPAAPDAAPATPATGGHPEEDSGHIRTALTWVGGIGMVIVGLIGFAASYTTLSQFAADNGFGPYLAPTVPIGIDVGIISFLAFDLARARRRGRGLLLLRMAAYALTLATVTFNAAEGGSISADPVRAALHAVMPLLFVIGVEAVRHELLPAGKATEAIPMHRWFLAPRRTGRLYRRMRLANVTSYDEMVQRERALKGYEVTLKQKYAGNLSRATEVERLPMTMAPEGFTVAEALALPGQWQAAADAREVAEAEAEQIRQEQADERAHQADLRAQQRAQQRELARLQGEGEIASAEHQVAAQVATAQGLATQARIDARTQADAAERAAEAEADAALSEKAAAARKRAAETAERAAEAEKRAAEERRRAERTVADVEAEKARKKRAVAEAEAAEAATAEARQRKAEADAAAAGAAQRAAEARFRAAAADEQAAAEEDLLRLPVTERQEYRIARHLLSRVPDSGYLAPEYAEDIKKLLSLEEVSGLLGVGQSQASDRRKNAVDLILNGYRGAGPLQS